MLKPFYLSVLTVHHLVLTFVVYISVSLLNLKCYIFLKEVKRV